MLRRLTFAQYLIGQSSLERPPFFYAYAVLWLHLLIGTSILAFAFSVPPLILFSSMAISSFCLSIVVYGLLVHKYELMINIGSYVWSLGRMFSTEIFSIILLIVAIIAALVSSYIMLADEYRRYNREIHNDHAIGVPLWIAVIMGTLVVMLCIFGLGILNK